MPGLASGKAWRVLAEGVALKSPSAFANCPCLKLGSYLERHFLGCKTSRGVVCVAGGGVDLHLKGAEKELKTTSLLK